MINLIKSLFNSNKPIIKKENICKNDVSINCSLVINPSSKEYDKEKLINTLNKQIGYIQDSFIYEVNPICPYCKNELPKKPIQKAKCKGCKNTIIVRTHYDRKDKILLTENELIEYEKKSKIYYSKKEIKRRLISSFSDTLDDNINLRTYINNELLKNKNEWNWGLYRNMTSFLANLDYLEDKKIDSLKKTLEVIYYDVNNPHNRGRFVIENNLQKEYPAFTPFDDRAVSDYWIEYIRSLDEELNITDIGKLFIEHNKLKYKELEVIPHKPEIIWERIKDKFKYN